MYPVKLRISLKFTPFLRNKLISLFENCFFHIFVLPKELSVRVDKSDETFVFHFVYNYGDYIHSYGKTFVFVQINSYIYSKQKQYIL